MKNQRIFKGKSLCCFPADFVLLDIETTGLSPESEDIIEISAIKVRDNKAVDTFSELINIKRPLPPFITSLTGITDKMLLTGDSAESVLYRFLDFTGGDIVLAHNANFDINFLYDKCLDKLGRIFDNDYVDTLKLARKYLPHLPHKNLDALADYFGLPPRSEHRALGDCEMTLEIYYRLKKEAEKAALYK